MIQSEESVLDYTYRGHIRLNIDLGHRKIIRECKQITSISDTDTLRYRVINQRHQT